MLMMPWFRSMSAQRSTRLARSEVRERRDRLELSPLQRDVLASREQRKLGREHEGLAT